VAAEGTTRRRLLSWFLGTSLGALVAAVLYPVLRFLTPPEVAEASASQVEAGRTNDPELLEQGFKIVQFGADPVIVIRVAEGDFRAFSAVCTHLACIVAYRPELRLIWYYCHDGIYDLTGKNIGGPPPRPLAPYVVHLAPGKTPGEAATLVVEKA
jgi:cytochrome b6-f complex iron-sulfur subunit